MAEQKKPEMEKLAAEALEEIGGGGVWDKITNMSPAKKAALGAGIAAALTYGGHEAVTGGAWTKSILGLNGGGASEDSSDTEPAPTVSTPQTNPAAAIPDPLGEGVLVPVVSKKDDTPENNIGKGKPKTGKRRNNRRGWEKVPPSQLGFR